MPAGRHHVAVIGAGIVGISAALELLRDGHEVTVVDPCEPGGEHAASFGNGGWASSSLAVPPALPGVWRSTPGYLLRRTGPLTISLRQLPALMPWFARFVLAGTEQRALTAARALGPLVVDSPARHLQLAKEAGTEELFETAGQMQAYANRAHFDAEAFVWRLRREVGVSWIELDAAMLRRREPDLDPRYTFGVLLEGVNCIAPGAHVAALAALARVRGATFVSARASGFRRTGERLQAVRLDNGELSCKRAVIAAGVWSKRLAGALGDQVPLVAERGYHVRFPPGVGPSARTLLMDGRMANTPSRLGLRVTGHAEFDAVEAPPNWARATMLRDFTLGAYPGNADRDAAERAAFWMGRRPSLPDGLPVIGPASGCPDVIHAFGHGHIGFCAGPMTGRIVADLIAGRAPPLDCQPFAVRRFRFLGWSVGPRAPSALARPVREHTPA